MQWWGCCGGGAAVGMQWWGCCSGDAAVWVLWWGCSGGDAVVGMLRWGCCGGDAAVGALGPAGPAAQRRLLCCGGATFCSCNSGCLKITHPRAEGGKSQAPGREALPGAQWQEGAAVAWLGPGWSDIRLRKKFVKRAWQICIQYMSSVLKDK